MSADAKGRRVEIYTDGACSGNPGPGGWAAIRLSLAGKRLLKQDDLSGMVADTTSNRMELTAVIEALKGVKAKRGRPVVVFSDSQYVVRGMNDWLRGWKARGWRTSAGKPVENLDLWQQLEQISLHHEVEWRWLRGHSGHPLNEAADRMASGAAQQAKRVIEAGLDLSSMH